MSDWSAEYKAKVREFLAVKGRPVEFEEKRYEWQADDEVSPYGWVDYTADQHIRNDGCGWVVPAGAKLSERTYSQFQDTFTDNANEVGVNVRGARCACGRYTDMTLRYVGSVQEMLHAILGLPHGGLEVEL